MYDWRIYPPSSRQDAAGSAANRVRTLCDAQIPLCSTRYNVNIPNHYVTIDFLQENKSHGAALLALISIHTYQPS
jgi:hypothetical protein